MTVSTWWWLCCTVVIKERSRPSANLATKTYQPASWLLLATDRNPVNLYNLNTSQMEGKIQWPPSGQRACNSWAKCMTVNQKWWYTWFRDNTKIPASSILWWRSPPFEKFFNNWVWRMKNLKNLIPCTAAEAAWKPVLQIHTALLVKLWPKYFTWKNELFSNILKNI